MQQKRNLQIFFSYEKLEPEDIFAQLHLQLVQIDFPSSTQSTNRQTVLATGFCLHLPQPESAEEEASVCTFVHPVFLMRRRVVYEQ